MSKKTLDTWAWALIYGGLGGVGLGLAVDRRDPMLGSAIAVVGGVGVLVGVLMIFVRSRLKGGDDA